MVASTGRMNAASGSKRRHNIVATGEYDEGVVWYLECDEGEGRQNRLCPESFVCIVPTILPQCLPSRQKARAAWLQDQIIEIDCQICR